MSYNLKYLPEYTNKKNNIFLEEFFTGTDTKIYLDGKECDFIAALSYSLQERVHPLYGYASFTFDSVATGTRIINGSIAVPVKNYDTLIQKFTDGEKGNHEVLQVANAYLPENEWIDKPYWVEYEEEQREEAQANVSKPKAKRVLVREKVEEDKETYKEEELKPTVKPEYEEEYINPREIICKKPKGGCYSDPYFRNSYSEDMFLHDFIQGKLKYNHKDFLIKMNGISRKLIKGVVFTGSEITYSSNDEPIYENLTFIARDVIDLDGAKLPEKNDTDIDPCDKPDLPKPGDDDFIGPLPA